MNIIYTHLAIACFLGPMPTSGIYEVNTANIYICASQPEEEQARALVHEIGHWIWFNLYTDLDRYLFMDAWSKFSTPLFPGPYAGLEEDFAILYELKYYRKKVPSTYHRLMNRMTRLINYRKNENP